MFPNQGVVKLFLLLTNKTGNISILMFRLNVNFLHKSQQRAYKKAPFFLVNSAVGSEKVYHKKGPIICNLLKHIFHE